MSKMIRGILATAVACILGAASVAWACEVTGRVICSGTASDPVPVPNVRVTFQTGLTLHDAGSTDASGAFATAIPWPGKTFSVTLDLTDAGVTENPLVYEPDAFCDSWGSPITLPTYEVNVPGCAPPPPPPPPPPPGCPALDLVTEGPFCASHPLGKPRAECAAFGLEPFDKNDNLSGASFTATTDAALALVKAGNCYNVYTNVTEGDTLNAPYTESISHVTYCSCPAR